MANATPEEAKAGMDAWMTWAGKAGSAVVDLGAPLMHGTHVGPGSAAAGDIAGFSILQADSLSAVEAVLDGHPHLHMPGGSIEVLELLSIPGM
jgi:hypothetical protein